MLTLSELNQRSTILPSDSRNIACLSERLLGIRRHDAAHGTSDPDFVAFRIHFLDAHRETRQDSVSHRDPLPECLATLGAAEHHGLSVLVPLAAPPVVVLAITSLSVGPAPRGS
jgi:hypothetical protein